MGNIIEFKSLFTFLLQNNKFPKMKLFIIQQLAGQDIPDLKSQGGGRDLPRVSARPKAKPRPNPDFCCGELNEPFPNWSISYT